MSGKSKFVALGWLLSIPLFFSLQLWWLSCSQFQVLAGDDLRSFSLAAQGLGPYYRLLASLSKFRPITALVIWMSTVVSGGRYSALLDIGIGIQTVNAFLVFWLLRGFFRLSNTLALGIILIAFFNRFTAYLMTPELAIMEGTALAVYLLLLHALLRLIETPSISLASVVGFFFFVLLHIHERYLVLAVPCIITSICIYSVNRSASIITFVCVTSSLGINFAIKKFLIHTPILVGTETRALDFNGRTIFKFFTAGLLNIGGINSGASYLSVLDYSDQPNFNKILSICVAASSLLLVSLLIVGIYFPRKESPLKSKSIQMLIVLGSLVCSLNLSASITFRQEYRWLYPVYLTFLVTIAFGTSIFGERFLRQIVKTMSLALLLALIIFTIPTELIIREHRGNYYSRLAYSISNNLYFLIVRTPALMKSDRVIIIGNDIPVRNYIFMGDTFSSFYRLPRLIFLDSKPNDSSILKSGKLILYKSIDSSFITLPATK